MKLFVPLLASLLFLTGCGLECGIIPFSCTDHEQESARDVEPNDTEAQANVIAGAGSADSVSLSGQCDADEEFDFFVTRSVPIGRINSQLNDDYGIGMRMYDAAGSFDVQIGTGGGTLLTANVNTAGDVYFVVLCSQTNGQAAGYRGLVSYYPDP